MYLDLELEPRELAILKQGGFLSFKFPNGMTVIIKKDEDGQDDEQDSKKETL